MGSYRWAPAILLLGASLGGLTLFYTYGRGFHSVRSAPLGVASAIVGVDVTETVSIPRAELTANYQDMTEHVPPYGPDGEMQAREKFG